MSLPTPQDGSTALITGASSGVSVTALCPGPVKSGFQDASGAHDLAAASCCG